MVTVEDSGPTIKLVLKKLILPRRSSPFEPVAQSCRLTVEATDIGNPLEIGDVIRREIAVLL